MSKKMIIGAFIFVGYIFGINYFLRNKIYSLNKTSDNETSDNETTNETSDNETSDNETNDNETTNETSDNVDDNVDENVDENVEDQLVQMEEIRNCENETSQEKTEIKYEKEEETKRSLRKLFEKKKYMIKLDKELADIKDRLEDIRNNLHNFN